jgi:V-type H+-transporting ATPase subunit E
VPYLISGEGDNTVIYTFTKKMNDAAVAKQLENMVSFIKKEAEEKAEEILAKAEEDFTIEKAKKVQAQKLKLMKEFERKMKEVEVQKKM